MTPEQVAAQQANPHAVPDNELPRYYGWVEKPRTPDHEGGEQPVVWTREEGGGIL